MTYYVGHDDQHVLDMCTVHVLDFACLKPERNPVSVDVTSVQRRHREDHVRELGRADEAVGSITIQVREGLSLE